MRHNLPIIFLKAVRDNNTGFIRRQKKPDCPLLTLHADETKRKRNNKAEDSWSTFVTLYLLLCLQLAFVL